MNDFSFSKILYLPSGGLSYSPFVFVKPLTMKINLLDVDPFFSHSLFEQIIHLIMDYVSFEDTSILDVYVQDIYYLWLYYLTTDLIDEINIFKKIKSVCLNCGTANSILVDFADADISMNSPVAPNPLHNEPCVIKLNTPEGDMIEVEFSYRRSRHNIEYSNLALYYTNDDDGVQKLAFYIITQMVSLKRNGEPIDKEHWYNFFLNTNTKILIDLYYNLLKLDEDFGIWNELRYFCSECKTEQTTFVFNNFYLSQWRPNDNKRIVTQQEDLFQALLSFARLPVFNLQILSALPVRFFKSIATATSKIKFHSGVIL